MKTKPQERVHYWKAVGEDGDTVAYNRGVIVSDTLKDLVAQHQGEIVDGIQRPVSLDDGESILAVFMSFYPNPEQQSYTFEIRSEPVPGTGLPADLVF